MTHLDGRHTASVRLVVIENPRVLGVVRISVGRDETTSPQRQREHIEHWCAGPSVLGTIVGWAEDLDVSGGVSPFKRPELGKWLNRRAGEFDVLCVWRLDRLTRRSRHFAELVDWCNEREKVVVSTSESLDLSTPMGKMFARIIAAFAEGELDTIQARSLDASRRLREGGAWFGGVEPFGYRFADRKEGGKRLVQDPVYAPLLRSLYERVVAGTPVNRLTKELNRQGIPTWRDHLRRESGRPTRNTLWTSKAISQALMNPRSAGYLLHKGEVVEGSDGRPVLITDEPILAVAEWERVVRALSVTGAPRTRSPSSPSLLTGVARCGLDGASLYVKRNTVKRAYKDAPDVYSSYMCRHAYSGAQRECRTAVGQEVLDLAVEQALLTCFAEDEVYERRETSKPALEEELRLVAGRLGRLEDDFTAGRYDGEGQEESYHRMHRRLAGKRTALTRQLEELPDVELIGTGRTFRELWAGKNLDERRSFLLDHDVRVLVWKTGRGLSDPHLKIEIPDVAYLRESAGLQGGRSAEPFIVDVNVPDDLRGVPVAEAIGREVISGPHPGIPS
jgi:DNA invertase Pin-like site-specific DNA recombinase